MNIATIDERLIAFFRRITIPAARIALFVIFFWFGLLKLIGLSPAGTIVHALFDQTLSWLLPFHIFYAAFAVFEMIIGILFLIRGAERVVMPLLVFHMVTTALPLFFLTSETFSSAFVPTLEGQYIIKNLALMAAAIGIMAHLDPLPRKTKLS